jgi:hypothetical protein
VGEITKRFPIGDPFPADVIATTWTSIHDRTSHEISVNWPRIRRAPLGFLPRVGFVNDFFSVACKTPSRISDRLASPEVRLPLRHLVWNCPT